MKKSNDKLSFINDAKTIASREYPNIRFHINSDKELQTNYQPLAWKIFNYLKEDYYIIMSENENVYKYTIKIDNEIFL